MRKLEPKLKYAIEVGVDFLLRNSNESGIICGETDLYKHALAAYCVAENAAKDKRTRTILSVLPAHSYYYGGSIFIREDLGHLGLNAISSLAFLCSEMPKLGLKYLNFVCSNQDKTGYIGGAEDNLSYIAQSTKAMIKGFEISHNRDFMDKAKLSLDWIVENGSLDDYWNMDAISSFLKHQSDNNLEQFAITMLEKNNNDLDMLANYSKKYGSDWEDKIKSLAYERLSTQTISSSLQECGGFFNEENLPAIDISQKNINAFNCILKMVKHNV